MRLIFILMLISTSSFSQIMSTHLLSYSKSINPIFSKKSKQISISFDKNSLIEQPEKYSCVFKIDISDRKSELTGVANDFNIGGAVSAINNYGLIGGLLSSGLSSSKMYAFRNTNGYVLFDRLKFDSLIKFSKMIVNVMSAKKGIQNYSQSFYFKVDNLEMTLEIPKTINENIITDESTNVSTIVVDKTIFLKIDESVFILTGDEFLSLFNNFLLDVEGFWNNYN
jgi:hypothetical protein